MKKSQPKSQLYKEKLKEKPNPNKLKQGCPPKAQVELENSSEQLSTLTSDKRFIFSLQ
jgi:hypothetical protein